LFFYFFYVIDIPASEQILIYLHQHLETGTLNDYNITYKSIIYLYFLNFDKKQYMLIFIKTLESQLVSLYVLPDDTIKSVKQQYLNLPGNNILKKEYKILKIKYK
jgi:hypothetical protein